ncbi:hypothetical protein CAOG_007799 [Capsaspora owczarzaki ATCC 30864]|uniref:Oxo-4-hydroxy-4-carboxy-5-ureidoimidazoline decarboxylase domain-containing protein n=1 Tax=Capsaspora owczarzaki (strain ATCC 30864) TaxID=595528 RepID=A0A0D2X5F0_CAPO3|nr:hypothetical protein CAOG_007799 [Capsaspora owczarzaki ATCC 30864]
MSASVLPSIEQVNAMTRPEELLEATSVLFESTRALTARLFAKRPFASYEALIDAAHSILAAATGTDALSDDEKIDILNAHPRIGAPTASLSALSKREQGVPAVVGTTVNASGCGGAASPAIDERTLAELAQLNVAYEAKYGFKFVIFVNGRTRAALLPEFRQRLASSTREAEVATGMRAMLDIARDRLSKLQSSAGARSPSVQPSRL